MDLLDLFVKVVFDSEEFEKGVKSVSEKAHKVSEDISQTTSNTVTSIKKETTEIEESAEQTAKSVKQQHQDSAKSAEQASQSTSNAIKEAQKVAETSAQDVKNAQTQAANDGEKAVKTAEKEKEKAVSDTADKNADDVSKSNKDQQQSSEKTKNKVKEDQKETEKQAGESAKKTAGHWKNAGEKIKAALKTAAKIGATTAKAIAGATAIATAGITKLVKDSVSGYGEYEQLVGGVKTLFKGSSNIVEKNAEKAFKTAQISANDYMETVTSFSASLIQGLGGDTEKAAKIADMAIIDMSDNANKMGTSMESIQNAYQGFAKQNYTMLDNLKLGRYHCSAA